MQMKTKAKKTEEKVKNGKPSPKGEKKAAELVVVPNEYKGQQMFTIAKSKDVTDGQLDEGAFPYFSCGLAKAKAILDHIEELKAYVEENA
jgi:hypothetical protein